MDGRDETQREREPHPMLELHDSRRGHIPGSEGARSKTRGIISHAGGARSMRGGGGGGLTSQAGDGLHDPEWGPTPRGDPCPGGVAKTDPAPRRKRGVAWPARSWGLPGGGRGLGGGGVATDAIRGAWSPPPPRRRRRARRTVRVGGGGAPRSLPPDTASSPRTRPRRPTVGKSRRPLRAPRSSAPTRSHGCCLALCCGTGASGGSEQRS